MDKPYRFENLVELIANLRSEDGCPWDRKQTHESLKNCMIEEAYEVCEGIDRIQSKGSYDNLCEELGDMLFQVVIHSRIAEESEQFDVYDVIEGICEKMIRRHPHVFSEDGRLRCLTEEERERERKSWDEIKSKEKTHITLEEKLLDVPNTFPALLRTQKVIQKCNKEGILLEDYNTLRNEVAKSLESLDLAVQSRDLVKLNEIMGEILFDIGNMACFLQINAENSLTNATNKFINRLIDVEHLAKAKGIHLREIITNGKVESCDHVK